VQREQIEYAKSSGIDAFCFHYYWFGGRTLLRRPLEDFLADADADIDFCLCWANENWTRRWDAAEHEILVEQTYSPESETAFLASLLPFFRDRRYLRVNGAPVLVVYRPQHLPDPRATAERWRRLCREWGVGEIHLVAALIRGNSDFEQFGFDAGVEFPPHNINPPNLKDSLAAYDPLEGLVVDYGDVAEGYLAPSYTDRRVYRTVFPSWDNTPRIGRRALVVLNGTPDNYERWLDAASRKTAIERPPEERLVFINAWNEWAEGCHLEPDQRHGAAFLEATLRVKLGRSNIDPTFTRTDIPQPDAVPEADAVEADMTEAETATPDAANPDPVEADPATPDPVAGDPLTPEVAIADAGLLDAAAVALPAIQSPTDRRRRRRRWLKKLRPKKLLRKLRPKKLLKALRS
jgi:lipopolysaccharide biosynthesis protein